MLPSELLHDSLPSVWEAIMRGSDEIKGSLFSYVDIEKRVRPDHPLRVIRAVAGVSRP